MEGEQGFATRDVLEALVAAGGGELAAQASHADIVVVAWDSPRLLLRGGDPRAVDVNWLLDCIALRGEFSFPAQHAIATVGALLAAGGAGEGRELGPSRASDTRALARRAQSRQRARNLLSCLKVVCCSV